MTSCSSSLDGINARFSFWANVKEGDVGWTDERWLNGLLD